MPGPWEKYAQPQAAPWEKYAQSAAPATHAATAPPQQGFLGSFADASGLSALGHAVAHPIDTVEGIPAAVKGAVQNSVQNVKQGVADYKQGGLSTTTRRDFGRALPIVGPALAQAQSQHDAGNNAGMAGTLAGTVAGLSAPGAAKEALPMVGPALTKVGEAGQDAGVGLLNKTVGTLKADFKRGVNPGRGYFEAGNGPSMSMQSIADKAADSKLATGKAMADLRASTPVTVPFKSVWDTLQNPLSKARELEMGPGGLGNTGAIDAYGENLKPALADIGLKGGNVSPQDVFQLKRSIAQNTNWSDPSQFNLKAVRQQQTAALGGLLNDNIPKYGDLAQRYGDLTSLAKRTQSRAETGSSPLTTLATKGFLSGLGATAGGLTGGGHGAISGALLGAALDSVPVKSTLASGLYYGGKGLGAVGDALTPLPIPDAATVAPAAYGLKAKSKQNEQDHRR